MPGVFSYPYTEDFIRDCADHGFNSLRLLVNPDSAADAECMNKLVSYVTAIGGRALIVLFLPSTGQQDPVFGGDHGNGRVDHMIPECVSAWRAIHEVFAEHPGVMYEIFNEPFGYTNAAEYLDHMLAIIDGAALPRERCILDGIGYADNVQAVAHCGWPGLLAYHFYCMWCAEGNRTQEGLSEKLQHDLSGLSQRVCITEFGGALNCGGVYEDWHPEGHGDMANVNVLRALHDAVLLLKEAKTPVRGAYFFHGWHNEDSYDFWAEANSCGQAKVKKILSALEDDVPALALESAPTVEVHVFRKDGMSYYLSPCHGFQERMADWGWSFEAVGFSAWREATQPGTVPIHVWRKKEMTFLCHGAWGGYGQLKKGGWRFEGVNFYAYPPDRCPKSARRVHRFKKGELAYYCCEDWAGFEAMTSSWGWEDQGVAFAVPQ